MKPTKRQSRDVSIAYLTSLTAFAVAMGHLEAVVVVYIRHILGMVPTPDNLDSGIFRQVPHWVITTEQGREVATIIMLVALAYLAGRTVLQRIATFLYAFAIWDIVYYAALKGMLNWPASLQTLDLLFLIPKPWYAPVWLPISISAVMITVALTLFAYKRRKQN